MFQIWQFILFTSHLTYCLLQKAKCFSLVKLNGKVVCSICKQKSQWVLFKSKHSLLLVCENDLQMNECLWGYFYKILYNFNIVLKQHAQFCPAFLKFLPHLHWQVWHQQDSSGIGICYNLNKSSNWIEPAIKLKLYKTVS